MRMSQQLEKKEVEISELKKKDLKCLNGCERMESQKIMLKNAQE